MDRFAASIALIGLLTCLGCNRSPQGEPAAEQNVAPAAAAAASPAVASPADVVSQFLDEIRRGGEDTRANALLTDRARAELQRIGQTVQPIGSPDARFEVTRYEQLPDDPTAALVHSVWSEPGEDGSSSDFQVVWAVHKQAAGWRISGLAMELQPGQDPMIIDFENGELMAKLLAVPEEGEPAAAAPAAAQASGPNESLSR